jgi:hypothetical protein
VLVDATERSGIDFKHDIFAGGTKALPETMAGGGALFDFDGDGNLDAFLLQGRPLGPDAPPATATSRLFRGRGDGTFEDVTERTGAGITLYGMGVAAGDVNGDGHVDLFVTGYADNRLLVNREGRRFEDVTASAGFAGDGWSTSAAFLDMDEDGDLDLYVTRYVDWSAEHHPRCGPAAGPRGYCHPDEFHGLTHRLHRNDGSGRFTEVGDAAGIAIPGGPWEAKGLGVVVADLDGDGHVDIYVANDSTRNFLFDGDGTGRFEDVSLRSGTAYNLFGETEAGMGVDVADVNADGLLDILVTNLDHEKNTLYRNMGGGRFEDASFEVGLAADSMRYVGFGTAFLDADRDGDPDVFIANGHVVDNVEEIRRDATHAQPALLYANDGTGHFVRVTGGSAVDLPVVGRGVARGDVDNDGDHDLLEVVNNGPARLLVNETPPRGRWAGFRLLGTRSNRDGIGAIAVVEAGGRRQVQTVQTSGGYLTAKDPRLLFGLGEATSAVLEVRWPSGAVDRIDDVPLDAYSVVEEGTGIVREP